MDTLKKYSKIVALLGLILGVIGFGWASLADQGKVIASWTFVVGFLMLSFGVLGSVLFTPASSFGDYSPWGIKIMAVGFAIAVVAGVMGELLLGAGHGTSNLVFYIGSGIMIIGIIIHAVSVFRNFFARRRDS